MSGLSFPLFGRAFIRCVAFSAVLLCAACGGGGGSGAGEGEGGAGVTLVPSNGTPVLLTVEGEVFYLSATCSPYRPGDYSGMVSDGKLTVRSLPDGTSLQADSLTGNWEQGLSSISGRVEPLLMELEGQRDDGNIVRVRLDELSLEISARDEAGKVSGRVLKGQLIVDRQSAFLLDGAYLFSVAPQP